MVGDRPERRRLVPRRRAAQVGRDPPPVLPRPRRRAGRAGRRARGLLRSRPRVRAGGARGHRRPRRDGRGGLRPRPAVRPGGRRLVRRRPPRPPQLQRRPGVHAAGRGADAGRRGTAPGQPARRQLPGHPGLRPGTARGVRRRRPALVHIGHRGADGRRVPQRPARPRPRTRTARASGHVPHRPRGLGSAVRLAAQQGRLRRAAGTRRHGRIRAPVPFDVPRRRPGRLLRDGPVGRGPRAGRRRGPRRRSTRSTCSRRSRTRARSTCTTGCCPAGCGWRRPPAPMCSCRSATAPMSRPTRRGGAGSTPSWATRRCPWRPSRTRCALGGRWSPTVRG